MYGGTAEQLKAYRVGITPPQNNWVEVEDTVFFQQVRPLVCSHRNGTNVPAVRVLKKAKSGGDFFLPIGGDGLRRKANHPRGLLPRTC